MENPKPPENYNYFSDNQYFYTLLRDINTP